VSEDRIPTLLGHTVGALCTGRFRALVKVFARLFRPLTSLAGSAAVKVTGAGMVSMDGMNDFVIKIHTEPRRC